MNWDDRLEIRAAYSKFEKQLRAGERISPYEIGIDWMGKFSPIEDRVWSDIRYLGLPLYPQYPIGNFFADFADPHLKIVIEVDGREFHRNKEKDRIRESKIFGKGWDVYRIPGWATMESREAFITEDGDTLPGYFYESSEGILIRAYEEHNYSDARVMYVTILEAAK